MDKIMGEEDLKGLEEEINDAVDRLFVEKKGGVAESFPTESPLLEPFLKSPVTEPSMKSPVLEPPMEPSFLEPSYEGEIKIDSESSFPLPSAPMPSLKSVEKMEAQLLSLEWEITEEKLNKTREEVLALQELLKQKTDIVSILRCMEKVLNYMIKNDDNIRPPWIKFLLDSKETIKLLMRKETEGEINIYKQLAYLGIESRFSSLEGMKDTSITQSSFNEEKKIENTEVSIPGVKKIEDVSNQMNLFMEKVEGIFTTMKHQISRLEEIVRKTPPSFMEARAKPINVTIFKVDEKLFGVETEKVYKLFKIPIAFHEKISDQLKIRLRDLEVKMINLKKIFSIPEGGHTRDIKILTVKDDGECKGLIVDQVLKKLSTYSEIGGHSGELFSGMIYFTYQENSVEIPILDLKKF